VCCSVILSTSFLRRFERSGKWLAATPRAVAELAEDQEPGCASGEARGGRGLGLLIRAWPPLRAAIDRGHASIMDTQITNKDGLTNNFWVQIGALVILTVVVIAFGNSTRSGA
jgi:hypothetical protein